MDRNELPHICIDVDGVIAKEGKIPVYGSRAGWNYSACLLVEGAREGLLKLFKRYHVRLYSARKDVDLAITKAWLDGNGIKEGEHYDVLDLGTKPKAMIYLDDRAVRFKSWRKPDVIKAINYAEAAIREQTRPQ